MTDFPKILFITGIDTDAGKTYATGWLANEIAKSGETVITQKFIQTGCKDMSEDVLEHRKIQGIDLQPRDIDHTTAPLILSYPASADLAARIDNVDVDYEIADRSSQILAKEFDHVLVEGAGGIMVPLKGEYLTIDYVKEHNLPVAVVTNGILGSINHTLLTFEVLKNRGIAIHSVIYNPYFDKDKIICEDTRNYLRDYLKKNYPETHYIEMPATV